MAKKDAPKADEVVADEATVVKTDDLVEARVLADCAFGKVDDVVSVPAAVAEAHPELDAHPDAVAYAKALKTEG